MKIKGVLAGLLVVLLLSAFAPLFAIALPEGRTLDEGHDSGYIDWSGGVNYANLNHRDALCPSTCAENVTQIQNGGTVSGVFAGDVSYFEVMLAYSNAGGFGTATIQACSSSYSVLWGLAERQQGSIVFRFLCLRAVLHGLFRLQVGMSIFVRWMHIIFSFLPPTPLRLSQLKLSRLLQPLRKHLLPL